jgi:hypothetical protein
MSAPLFPSRPERCSFGHSPAPGAPQRIGWKPCLCDPAREAAEAGCGMGHIWIWCIECDDAGRDSTFYEPPHDTGYREPGAWQPPRQVPDGLAVLCA